MNLLEVFGWKMQRGRAQNRKKKKMEDLRTQPPRSTATTASTITICHHHLNPQESQPPPSKIEGQKNGEMPKRGRRVTKVVWEERECAKRKEEKTKRRREKDNSHMREKRAKENKIILNIWRGVVSLAGVNHWFYASFGSNGFSSGNRKKSTTQQPKLLLNIIFNKYPLPLNFPHCFIQQCHHCFHV